MEQQRIELCFTFEELGAGAATIEQLYEGLAPLAAPQCLNFLALMNSLIRDSSEPVNAPGHAALVRLVFPPEVGEQILKSKRFALHRQQLLFMMKAVLLACKGEPREWKKEDFRRFGVLCLMGGDLVPTIPSEASTNDLERAVRIVLHFTPVQEAARHHPEHNITRSYLMLTHTLEQLKAVKGFIDVRGEFEKASGFSLDTYFAFMLGILTRFYNFDLKKYLQDRNAYQVNSHWFSTTKIPEEISTKILKDLSASPEELSVKAQAATGPSDFTLFRDKPLVRQGDLFYPVDFDFLAAKTEANIYWTVLRHLSSELQPVFQSCWGRLFESYAAYLVGSSVRSELNAVYPFVVHADDPQRELMDIVVKCRRAAVLIECKGAMFRGDAKYKGDVRLLEREIRRKFVYDDRPIGVGQLAAAIEAISEDRDCGAGVTFADAEVVFPVLVTRDEIGSVVGFNRYLQLEFEQHLASGRRSRTFSVAPLVCMSVEALERWCSYLNVLPFSEILHSHIQANKDVNHPLLSIGRPLPPFVVGNKAIERIGERPARLHSEWKLLFEQTLCTLGLSSDRL